MRPKHPASCCGRVRALRRVLPPYATHRRGVRHSRKSRQQFRISKSAAPSPRRPKLSAGRVGLDGQDSQRRGRPWREAGVGIGRQWYGTLPSGYYQSDIFTGVRRGISGCAVRRPSLPLSLPHNPQAEAGATRKPEPDSQDDVGLVREISPPARCILTRPRSLTFLRGKGDRVSLPPV